MGAIDLEEIKIKKLKEINVDGGNVIHGIKSSDANFYGFGEIYFSFVDNSYIKAWKKHTRMVLNLVVVLGEIEFVIYDEREKPTGKGTFFTVKLSKNNYQRLTVPHGVWMAFKGIGSDSNMLLNLASIEHDSSEAVSIELNKIIYNWE